MEPTLINNLVELDDYATRLGSKFLQSLKYVGFDLELSLAKKPEIMFIQIAFDNEKIIIIKIGEQCNIKNVLQNNFVRSLLVSESIAKVGVGISGML